MKKLLLLLSAGILIFTSTARAQYLTGSIGAEEYAANYGLATASSFSLIMSNIVESTTGSFAGTVPVGSIIFASGGASGLSGSPTTVSIDNFLRISYPYGVAGTTPDNRFDFDLSAVTENSYNSSTGAAMFTGTGTLVDTTGGFQTTPGEVLIDFSNANTYTLTVEAVPEPATLSLAVLGLVGAVAFHRRKT